MATERLEASIIFKQLPTARANTRSIYAKVVTLAIALLMAKVLVSIVWEYRLYFPANFDAAFLVGREKTFVGLYRIAFYLHILTGPLVVVLAAGLMLTGGRSRFRKFHRWIGRILVLMVLTAIVPSGFVMAQYALSGPIAGVGFALQTAATAISATAAIRYARHKKFSHHQRWAVRCFILLSSPLLFRIVGGTLYVFDIESGMAYTLNAWLSWSVPLCLFEVLRSCKRQQPLPVP